MHSGTRLWRNPICYCRQLLVTNSFLVRVRLSFKYKFKELFFSCEIYLTLMDEDDNLKWYMKNCKRGEDGRQERRGQGQRVVGRIKIYVMMLVCSNSYS